MPRKSTATPQSSAPTKRGKKKKSAKPPGPAPRAQRPSAPSAESHLSQAVRSNTFTGNLGGAQVPRNWMPASLGSIPAADNETDLLCYLKSLVNPEMEVGAKIPDGQNHVSATYQTVYTIPVYGNTALGTAAVDKGRFAVLIQPVMTDSSAFNATSQQGSYWLADPAQTWTLPVAAAGSFVGLDPNYLTMVPSRTAARKGLMERARPVSMSAWFQYNADLINNGGEVAAALVTGDTWMDNLTAFGGVDNFANWDNLADYPSAYQGKLCDGTYTWWKPNGTGDMEFRPTDSSAGGSKNRAMVNYDYPCILIAGQANHPGDSTANQPVGRVRVCVNYEYTTDSRVVAQNPSPVSPLALTLAQKWTSGQPTSMANEDHTSWMRDLLKYATAGVAGFFVGGPIGAAAAVLAVLGARRV